MPNLKRMACVSSAMVLVAIAGTAASHAATTTPTALLENSQSYAIGNQFKAFRVPVRNSNGAITYQDVTVTLTVSSTGAIATSATVAAAASPSVTTGTIVPGTYSTADGKTICSVRNVTLTSGRVQSTLACKYSTNTFFEIDVATGPINLTHPYLQTLKDWKVDALGDANTYTWGIVGSGYYTFSGCNVNSSAAVGAKSDGNRVVLSMFRGNPPTVHCGVTLTRQ